MSNFQLIALVLLFGLGFKQFLRFREAPVVKILYRLRWFFLTFLALLFVGDPKLSSLIAEALGISRGVDVVIYFALIWLLYQNYGQSQEIEKLYEKIDELVRKLALKDVNGRESAEKTSAVTKRHKE